jgi:hypothetical protein
MNFFTSNRTEIGLLIITAGISCFSWRLGIVSAGICLLVPDLLTISARLMAKRK